VGNINLECFNCYARWWRDEQPHFKDYNYKDNFDKYYKKGAISLSLFRELSALFRRLFTLDDTESKSFRQNI